MIGGSHLADIVVENTLGQPAWVECSASDFSTRSRDESLAADVEIDPMRFPLGSGESRDVVVGVRLSPELFEAETDYFGILRIRGAGDHEMIVQIVARAEAPEAPAEVATT